MAGLSNYLEDETLNHLTGKTTYPQINNLYLAVSTTPYSDDGTGGSEPSTGNGYNRVQTNAASWNNANNGVVSNAIEFTYPQATGSWGTLAYLGIFDAASGGNLLASGNLTTAKAVNTGDTLKMLPGAITITMD